MQPCLRHVGEARKAAPQLDDGGELAALDQRAADGIGGGVVNAEHVRRVVTRPRLRNAGALPAAAMSSKAACHTGDSGYSWVMSKS